MICPCFFAGENCRNHCDGYKVTHSIKNYALCRHIYWSTRSIRDDDCVLHLVSIKRIFFTKQTWRFLSESVTIGVICGKMCHLEMMRWIDIHYFNVVLLSRLITRSPLSPPPRGPQGDPWSRESPACRGYHGYPGCLEHRLVPGPPVHPGQGEDGWERKREGEKERGWEREREIERKRWSGEGRVGERVREWVILVVFSNFQIKSFG